jgi:hypothetical protein
MTSDDVLGLVEALFRAYNAKDFDAMEEYLAPDLHFAAYNRESEFNSSTDLLAAMKQFASEFIPDRTLGPALRRAAVNNVVYREQIWSGTLITDVAGFGAVGDHLAHRLCSVLTIGQAGRIVEYIDYG